MAFIISVSVPKSNGEASKGGGGGENVTTLERITLFILHVITPSP